MAPSHHFRELKGNIGNSTMASIFKMDTRLATRQLATTPSLRKAI